MTGATLCAGATGGNDALAGPELTETAGVPGADETIGAGNVPDAGGVARASATAGLVQRGMSCATPAGAATEAEAGSDDGLTPGVAAGADDASGASESGARSEASRVSVGKLVSRQA